uniref:Uncharacterized protein n=1 Tax=Oryza nivara TaxID=4536 RepID=A0A0E0FYN8_ORYNI
MLAPLRRIHFAHLPFLFPLNQATTTPLFTTGDKLFYSPFRPHPSSSLPSTTLPGCASLGNTNLRRRRSLPATGAPPPHSASPLSSLGSLAESPRGVVATSRSSAAAEGDGGGG